MFCGDAALCERDQHVEPLDAPERKMTLSKPDSATFEPTAWPHVTSSGSRVVAEPVCAWRQVAAGSA
jgi:hypothetical protein